MPKKVHRKCTESAQKCPFKKCAKICRNAHFRKIWKIKCVKKWLQIPPSSPLAACPEAGLRGQGIQAEAVFQAGGVGFDGRGAAGAGGREGGGSQVGSASPMGAGRVGVTDSSFCTPVANCSFHSPKGGETILAWKLIKSQNFTISTTKEWFLAVLVAPHGRQAGGHLFFKFVLCHKLVKNWDHFYPL